MAVRTSSQAGNWNDTATWGGSAPPGLNDTAVIGHLVTVTANVTVGNSGGSTEGVTINAGGLTINDGVTLTCSARMTVYAAVSVTVGSSSTGGATLTFTNASGVAGVIGAVAGVKLILNGLSTNRAVLSYSGSGGQATITGNGTSLALQGSYATVSGLSNSSQGMVVDSTGSSLTSFSNFVFTGCEFLELHAAAASHFTMTDTTFKSTVGSSSVIGYFTTGTSGNRTITGCCFDKICNLQPNPTNVTNLTFDNNLCEGQLLFGAGTLTSCQNNFITNAVTSTVDTKATGTYLNNYLYSQTTTNPHFWTVTDITSNASMTFDGSIYEQFNADYLGDCVLSNPSSARSNTLTMRAIREIVLPNTGGYTSGSPINAAKFVRNLEMSAEHCTFHVGGPLGDDARGAIVERGATGAYLGSDIIDRFKNNIAWDSSSGRGYKLVCSPDTTNGEVDSGTATGGSATTLNDTGKSWSTNIFTAGTGAGTYKVRITGGTSAGSVGTISSNNGTQLTVGSWSAGSPAASSAYKIFIVDVVTVSGVTKNCGYNTASGSLYDSNGLLVGASSGNGYHQANTSTGSALGSDDLSVDPQFTDSSRDLAAWDATLGGAGTAASAIAELRKRNESNYNTNYIIASLVTYVKNGFIPQNASLQAASDAEVNGWIGAVAGTAATNRVSMFGGN